MIEAEVRSHEGLNGTDSGRKGGNQGRGREQVAHPHPEREQSEEDLDFRFVLRSMLLVQDLTETSLCSVCKSKSARLVAQGHGKQTHIGLMVVEVISRQPRVADVHPLTDPFLVRAFGCTNKMCGHIDFFSHVGSPDIAP